MPSPCPKQSIISNSQVNEKRRNSISSMKRDHLPERPRSHSLSQEPVGIMSSIKKIRENLLNSPEFKSISNKPLRKENSKTNAVANPESSIDRKKRNSVGINNI